MIVQRNHRRALLMLRRAWFSQSNSSGGYADEERGRWGCSKGWGSDAHSLRRKEGLSTEESARRRNNCCALASWDVNLWRRSAGLGQSTPGKKAVFDVGQLHALSERKDWVFTNLTECSPWFSADDNSRRRDNSAAFGEEARHCGWYGNMGGFAMAGCHRIFMFHQDGNDNTAKDTKHPYSAFYKPTAPADNAKTGPPAMDIRDLCLDVRITSLFSGDAPDIGWQTISHTATSQLPSMNAERMPPAPHNSKDSLGGLRYRVSVLEQ
ncbi:hypothetical protein B0H19DRAFT_1067641 [Mycena capillaripes]|nr:hypothetical protein B0H19DRAFT_1067641 [Mycena capillaripes]